jgi:hypothetical protein
MCGVGQLVDVGKTFADRAALAFRPAGTWTAAPAGVATPTAQATADAAAAAHLRSCFVVMFFITAEEPSLADTGLARPTG